MSGTSVAAPARGSAKIRRAHVVRLFELSVILPTIALILANLALSGFDLFQSPSFSLGVAFWIVVIAVVELLPVPTWKSLQLSLAFPLFTAVAFLPIYPPAVAGLVGLLG